MSDLGSKEHLFEAGKYCTYSITHDPLGDLLPPSLTVATLAGFFEIPDNYDTRRDPQ